MDKPDKKFEQMMKGIRIDTPSADFTLKVMSRVLAEAAVKKHSLPAEYQPVISRKTWIVMIVFFVLLTGYLLLTNQEPAEVKEPGLWSPLSGALQNLNIKGISNVWQSLTHLFTGIPPVAWLILTASLALWTLDSFLVRFMHDHSKAGMGQSQ
jgi:hypothetical protein